MNNLIKITSLATLTWLFILTSCKKLDDTPSLGTIFSQGIKPNSAKLKCSIINDGGHDITEKGFCYSLTANPTVLNNKAIDNSSTQTGPKEIGGTVVNLSANTLYYFKAFATNEKGTDYSSEFEFTTPNYLINGYLNGTFFSPTSFIENNTSANIELTGYMGNQYIQLILPANLNSTGTFPLLNNSNYDLNYSDGSSYFSVKTGTGSITVSNISAYGEISGSFSCTVENSSNLSQTKSLASFSFKVFK